MSDQPSNPSRFTSQTVQNKTTNERLSSNTVGLVKLSDFRKRRAEVLEQQERESREASSSALRSGTVSTRNSTPVSEGGGDDDDQQQQQPGRAPPRKKVKNKKQGSKKKLLGEKKTKSKLKANSSVGVVPKAVTKSALRKEAAEREALRQEFIAQRDAVKATEIAIPFIFYDGANIPGGTVRVKKGDFVWFFLDKSRKVGAELGVGEKANATRTWARVGVDDLILVRGTVILPHHYDFYYFLVNKSLGPGGQRIFNYSAEAPKNVPREEAVDAGLMTAAEIKAAAAKRLADISTLEGANDDPTLTKVVDRRWYERNKHIYPASTWQDFDPEKDYTSEVRRDAGGNTLFFSR
uniref:FAM50A/XAP5 C-terminal domain-containing protein n=1 Tax=Bionectria ochroleuca TaxID=29856 RepID=A0A8H7N6L7_BIOOC